MNYSEIISAAKAYVDRYDQELADAIPSFSRVVESKINTALKVGEQSVRAQIHLEKGQEYYALPDDFGGMRDLELIHKGSASIDHKNSTHPVGGHTLVYLNPEEMNKATRSDRRHRHFYYTVIADQLQICPPNGDDLLEMVYYQLVPPLVEDADTNWLTNKHPDAYIFGLCAEMAAFAKDAEMFSVYDSRFKESLANITQDDQVTRWSGPSLRVQTEGLVV